MIPLVMSIIAKTETFQRDMAKARGHVGKFGTSVKSTSTIVSGFSRQLLALAGVGGGLYAIKAGLTSSIRTFADFERGMANVSTLLDDQSMRLLPSYSAQVRRMSTTFGEGTEILSKGLYDIISASVAPTKAMKVLEVSVKAAKAGMSDTATAADALTTILNSYGYEAEKAERVSDILFTTIRRGKTTFAELAPNIGKVTSVAATAGLSFEELSAAIATMTRAGVQTEIAITSLRALILSFLKPQKDSIEMAKKYGVELNSNTLKTEGLTGVIEKLQKATAEELAVIVPTSRAITGFAAAIKDAKGNVADLEAALHSEGATEEAHQKVAKITSEQLKIAKQHWIDLKRTIGEEVAPALNKLLPVLNQITTALGEMNYNLFTILPNFKALNENVNKFAGGGGGRFGGKGATGGWGEGWEEPNKPEQSGGYQYAAPDFSGLDQQILNNRKKQDENAKAANKAAYDIAAAYDRMYQDIDKKSAASFEARRKLIEAQYDLYAETITDEVALAEWRANELEKLAIEEAKATGGFIEGFGAGIAELQREMQTLGELGADVAKRFTEDLVSGLNEVLWRTKDINKMWKDMLETIGRMITQWLIMQAVMNSIKGIGGAFSGLFGGASLGASSFHSGGIVGQESVPIRTVPASAFAGAPRLHEGLARDEYPAILQRGETIIPKNGGTAKGGVESLLTDIKSLLEQRQTINANVVDYRNVITKERLDGRDGETSVMRHLRRNS